MVVPVGLVMVLKPPEQRWYIRAGAMTALGGLRHWGTPFSGASLQRDCLIKDTYHALQWETSKGRRRNDLAVFGHHM